MSLHGALLDVLLGTSVLLALVSAVGVAVMPDPFQKLHFIAPAATLTPFALAAAAFLDEPQWQAGAKALTTALLLTAMNGVVTHATARAFRIRTLGRWRASSEDEVEGGAS